MNEKKRVLCIVSNMDTGGAETFLMKLLRNMDRDRYMMDFCVSGDNEGYYDKEINELGGKVFKIHRKTENLWLYMKDLYHVVKDNKYESVLRITSNCLGSLDLWVAFFAGAKKRLVRSSNAGDGYKGLALKIHEILRVPLNSIAQIKIAPSDLAAEYSFGKGVVKRNKVIYLNNAIDTSVFRFNKDKREALREELGVSDKFVITHVGRLNAQKNHKFLFEIFSELIKLKPEAVLLVIGQGELKDKLEAQAKELGISDKIKFLGVRSDVPHILSASDFMIFPSFYEGMPNVVIEAQGAGLRCLISDTITKEAKITDLVTYMSLSESAEKWADEVNRLSFCETKPRAEYISDLKEKGYDIKSSAEIFCKLI